MKLFGFRIGWPLSKRRRSKKAPTRLEKACNAGLIEDALKSPETLHKIVDKFGALPAHQEDDPSATSNSIKDALYDRAVETALSDRRRELIARVDKAIDGVMGAGERGEGRHEPAPAENASAGLFFSANLFSNPISRQI